MMGRHERRRSEGSIWWETGRQGDREGREIGRAGRQGDSEDRETGGNGKQDGGGRGKGIKCGLINCKIMVVERVYMYMYVYMYG